MCFLLNGLKKVQKWIFMCFLSMLNIYHPYGCHSQYGDKPLVCQIGSDQVSWFIRWKEWVGGGGEPEEMVVRSRGLMLETSSGLKLVDTNCLMSSNEVTHVLRPPAEPVRTWDSSHWDMVRIIMVAKLEFSGMSNICKSSGILALHWKRNK